jgi:hypothetical protein
METLKQFGDKHVSMETHGQQYNTTIYNINFDLGHTTLPTFWRNILPLSSWQKSCKSTLLPERWRQNISNLLQNYMASHSTRQYSSYQYHVSKDPQTNTS